MEQERDSQVSMGPEIHIDRQPVESNQRENELIEPQRDIADGASEGEFDLNPLPTQHGGAENETGTNEAEPIENTGMDKAPSPDKSGSEPQSLDDPWEQKSKLKSDAENAPFQKLSKKEASEVETPAGNAETIGELKEALEKEDVDDDSGDQVEPVDVKANDKNRTVKRSNLSKSAISIILMFVVIVGSLAYAKTRHHRSRKESPNASQPVALATEEVSVASTSALKKPEQNDPYKIYRVKLRDLIRLRETLLLKKHEIAELIKHYRKGVKTLENEILQEALRNNVHTFQEALNNKRIELKLGTIQRRLVYIDKLDTPLKWLEQGGEELLYLKRKANIDLLVAEIVSGIDMDMHMQQINAALQKYRLSADNLAINTEGAEVLPQETLWEELYSKTKSNPHLLADVENWFIEQEICSGDLHRIGELPGISAEALRCIVQMEGSDLFLNGIEELSPTIAKQLYQWRGKWICLNGVKLLSPSAAKYLFQWEGEWISLNGLSAFPPELAKYLGQWKGKQLELMGLAFNKDQNDEIAFKYLAEWEKAGGKLFVPDSIRTMIDLVKQI